MDLFKRAAAVASINFKRWLKDHRVRFSFLFIGYLMIYYVSPLRAYAAASDQTCSAWLLPVLFCPGSVSVGLAKMFFHIGMLVLLCDAPFLSAASPYMIIRSGRRGWWMGECLYILLTALVYTLFLTVLPVLILFPRLEFGNAWGGVIHDLTFGVEEVSAQSLLSRYQYQNGFPSDVVRVLYPQGAMLYTFTAVWASFSFLGLLMYFVSLISRRFLWGLGIAGCFVFADPLLCWLSWTKAPSWVVLLSPVCWTSIGILQVTDYRNFLTIPMALLLYALLIVFLIILIGRSSRHAMIGKTS